MPKEDARGNYRMVFLDTDKIFNCVDWENVTKDKITINVDGEKLKQTIYEDLEVKIKEGEDNPIKLTMMDYPFVEIYPNEIMTEDDCKRWAIEIRNTLNNRIKSKLKL